MAQPRVLFAVGSLRSDSLNRQLAQLAIQEIKERAAVSFLDYADLPYMDQDIEFPPPEPVARLRNALHDTDGLWIISPEYNHGIPGGLKNMLDWASRPVAPNQDSVVVSMPVTISGAGGASGTACMQDKLLSVLAIMRMRVMGTPTTAVNLDAEAFLTNTLPVSESLQRKMRRQANAFLAFIAQDPEAKKLF